MFRLLADENFRGSVLRGLLRLHPELDILRAQDVGLTGADDRTALAWAAEQQRIVLTRDRATMPYHGAERIEAGESFPGMFVLRGGLSRRQAIDELLLIVNCSEPDEWEGLILHLPL